MSALTIIRTAAPVALLLIVVLVWAPSPLQTRAQSGAVPIPMAPVAQLPLMSSEQAARIPDGRVHDPFEHPPYAGQHAEPVPSPYPPVTLPPPRPIAADLQLAGVLGGPPWQAFIRGLPGHGGVLALAPGETAAGWRVVHVAPDSAVLLSVTDSVNVTLRVQQ